MNVNIGREITIDVILENIGLSPTDLAPVAAHVVYIGLRNILMDCHAGAAAIVEEDGGDVQDVARGLAEKKLAALYAGEVRVAGTRTGDPVRAEALRMATAILRSALKKAGRKLADVDAKALRAKAEELLVRDSTLMERARARVAEQAATIGDADLTAGL